ncbi:hypothetical protein H8B09_23320 [Paenibacillus sp. PR3]|uniref:RNA polymerase sigma-70 region 4 domain-containing protein n=1 Tax=Paenibacillus terricola TaxID=2763503 RepID=A0ABR8N0K0_9BACL|nr:hypothetical protein [Paenibacillus terricola]
MQTSYRVHNVKSSIIPIYKNLDILDDREKEVVVGRFGLIDGGEERTQWEIAKELGNNNIG